VNDPAPSTSAPTWMDHTVWRRAAHLRADAVVVLPDADGEDRLYRWLTGQADPAATTEPEDSDGDLAPP